MKDAVEPTAAVIGATVGMDDLARELSLSRRSLSGAIRRGEFPPADIRIGRRMRWRRETIVDWVASQARERS